MSDYKIKEEDLRVINASKLSESKKDSFSYNLRRTENGWIVFYDHHNVDQGLVKSERSFLPDDIIDILTTYHAKSKLSK